MTLMKDKKEREKYYRKLGFFKPEPKTPPNTPEMSPRNINGNLVINIFLRENNEKYTNDSRKLVKR